jgi:predicted methyltransferase
MFVHAAQAMGYDTAVLDPDADSPAGRVSHHHICSDYQDPQGLEQLAALCGAVTTEFENVPAAALSSLAAQCRVAPGAAAVAIAQDRMAEKAHFLRCGVPCAPFVGIASAADLDNPKLSEAARKGRAAFEARYADETRFGKVGFVNFGPASKPLGAPGSADMVITARNIHNWMWQPGVLDKSLADFYAVLKPGGVLAVEEHRADPRPQIGDARDGYVATQTVVDAATKAGFKLAGSSEANANPKDTKDHPFGVWTLPPSRWTAAGGRSADPAFDRSKYDAIGESDRMTLRFVKPR